MSKILKAGVPVAAFVLNENKSSFPVKDTDTIDGLEGLNDPKFKVPLHNYTKFGIRLFFEKHGFKNEEDYLKFIKRVDENDVNMLQLFST